jgi:Concanavalin A-like lectin/glucanases superfamily
MPRRLLLSASFLMVLSSFSTFNFAQTIALWPFDEQQGLYPSSVLSDVSSNDYPLVLGPGGQVIPGKFGNALEPGEYPAFPFPQSDNPLFGLGPVAAREGRKPLTWRTARFCALMTSGENHLRNEVGFANATETKLNLGDFDWTVEFWFLPVRKAATDGVVFEVGRGPRGDSNEITQLALTPDHHTFVLINHPSRTRLPIPTDSKALAPGTTGWRHLAFVYSHRDRKLRHYVDGKEQRPPKGAFLKSLPVGPEAYFSVGRDGLWQKPLQGRIDELRFSSGMLYTRNFTPPSSFSPLHRDQLPTTALNEGPPLLFAGELKETTPVQLGDRKHLFIDEALVKQARDVVFQVNPPALAECVIDNIQGPFRKHLNVLEDESGLIRLYYGSQNDSLAVQVSKDGIHFEAPRASKNAAASGPQNLVIPEPAAMGMVFMDPNAVPEERWKFVSDFHRRGIFLYSSPDGWTFKRHPIAILPFRSGSQSNIFYDEQRQRYVAYHRSDFPRTVAGKTQREFVRTETRDIAHPWPFTPLTFEALEKIALHKRLARMRPFFLDNGPLTPGGFGVEYPTAFAPDDSLDPVGTDVYVPKAMKYPWALDTYLAFPLMYFHYEDDGPKTRQVLREEGRGRGSGPIEAQLSVSRDGVQWKRYPRPAYVGIGTHHGDRIHQAYLAHGMVRRGSEIWQY